MAPQAVGLLRHHERYRVRIEAVMREFSIYFTGMLGPVPESIDIVIQLPTDCGILRTQQLGYLREIVPGFHEGVKLIPFSLAEVFAGHKQIRLRSQKTLNAKHTQLSSLPLIKISLRA